MDNIMRIAVLSPADYGYCRGVLRGIYSFARPTMPWVFHSARASVQSLPMLKEWNPAGLIAHLTNAEFAQELVKLGKPIVNTSFVLADLKVPRVGVDDYAIGRLAAQHFLERGFKAFAFIGEPDSAYSRQREAGYRSVLEEKGHGVSAFSPPQAPAPGQAPPSWEAGYEAIRHWLLDLTKPVAVFTCNDHVALRVGEALRIAAMRVPEDVALLGVDDDDLICNMAYPPLSSVKLPAETVGYRAAELLNSLINGMPAPEETILLEPVGVAVRRSSDTLVRRTAMRV